MIVRFPAVQYASASRLLLSCRYEILYCSHRFQQCPNIFFHVSGFQRMVRSFRQIQRDFSFAFSDHILRSCPGISRAMKGNDWPTDKIECIHDGGEQNKARRDLIFFRVCAGDYRADAFPNEYYVVIRAPINGGENVFGLLQRQQISLVYLFSVSFYAVRESTIWNANHLISQRCGKLPGVVQQRPVARVSNARKQYRYFL